MKPTLLRIVLLCFSSTLFAQVFESKTTLYSNSNAFSGWYTESIYSPLDSHNDSLYFIMLDDSRKPRVGRYFDGETNTVPLDKNQIDYQPLDDGHQEYSIGVDKEGYIHVTGDLHNFPQGNAGHVPNEYSTANILYWKSSSPGDISSMVFIGNNAVETIPGIAWSYGNFTTDRNGELYYISRTLARQYYYQNGGRGLGLYWYDSDNKQWVARGVNAPKSDASYPVIAWEESGKDGGSYQQHKGNIRFDTNNRMHLTVGMNTQNGPAQVNSVIYAYSDDGGLTFHKANGDNITLPMQVASGERQADVIDSNPSATFEQPSLTYAFNNQPVIHYTASSNHYYQYWDGSKWSGRIDSPIGMRARLLFNDHTQELLMINISDGSIYAKSSFEGSSTFYDAGETFRYFDIKTFYKKNVLNGISWKASSGNFALVQLKSGKVDCYGDLNGDAEVDGCGICAGGNTTVLPCVSIIEAESYCELLGDTETVHKGYLGESYINSENIVGANALWLVTTPTGGDVQMSIRYANKGSLDRAADLKVGNGFVDNVSFEITDSWEEYDYVHLNIPLESGANFIELKATTNEGLANIDQLSFSKEVSLEECGILSVNDGASYGGVYPNPTKGLVILPNFSSYEVYSIAGELLLEGESKSVPLSELPIGVYVIKTGTGVFRVITE